MHASIKDSTQDLGGSTPRSKTLNHFKTLLTKQKKFNFIVFRMKLFRKFKL